MGVLDGQFAIVIGGGSGIGLGSARLLAKDGASVTLAGRTEDKLKDAQATLLAEGFTANYAVCDAMSSDSVKAAVAAASNEKGGIDIATVVPGGGNIKPVLLFESDEFAQGIDMNVRPVFNLLKWAGLAMVRNGSGSFVAISSTAAVFSARYLAPYCAGKAAVDQLVRVAADELGEYNIRVNSVQPGLTRTPTTEGTFKSPEMLDAFLDQQPLRRGGEVNDIAQAVRYFAGPESGWTTGQLLTVDGGHTLRAFVDYAKFIKFPDVRAEVSSSNC